MDAILFQMINGLAGKIPWLDILMIFSAKLLPVAFALAFITLYLTRQASQQRGAFLAGASTLIALSIAITISILYPRPRPYLTHTVHLLIERSHDPSFPSDHAVFSFAIATMVWRYNRKAGIVFAGLAILVGFSRIYVGTHYPLDVIGGAALGIIVSLIVDNLARQNKINNLLNGVFETLYKWHVAVKPE